MNVLIACEFSGVVREAFWAYWERRYGQNHEHKAVSVDLLPTERPGSHFQSDIFEFIRVTPYAFDPLIVWDLMIAFPPCTHLAVSGARWFKEKAQEQADAIAFVERLWDQRIARIAIENPIGVLSTRSKLGKPDQIVQPWMFGHGETKATCLWLKNLPPLAPMSIVEGREGRVWREPPGPDRWKNRSRTYAGIATAMAAQWGDLDTLRMLDKTPEDPTADYGYINAA